MNGPTIVFTTAILAIAISTYYMLKTRHLERMSRIENGMAEPLPPAPRKRSHDYLLIIGYFFVGIGAGLVTGHFIEWSLELNSSPVIPACIMLCSGVSLILARSASNKDTFNSDQNTSNY